MDGNYFWTLWLLVEEMEGFWKTTILLEMEKQAKKPELITVLNCQKETSYKV